MYAQDNNSLPVWILVTSLPNHISINSQPFLVGIVSGKSSDQDLESYPAVHLTGPHEWDPFVLDYTHPSGDGEPPWSNDPNERYAFDPNFD